ncbi:MAG TPA: S4 domain-containing protein [Candidatus Saccharimonadales bacterium]|nr:S4 domain-containing protein [Candidatus Saccharimonadales bacterium]
MASKGNTRHIKRLASSRYMKIGRKTAMYVAKPLAGRHSSRSNIALTTVLKEKLMDATSRDVRYLLNNREVEVNGKAVKEEKYPVGFGDMIHLRPSGESYKVVSGKGGSFALEKADHAKHKQTFKVIGKYVAKGGRILVRLHDGRSFAADNKVKVNDSVVIGKKGIEKVIPLGSGKACYVISGTHASESGKIKEIAKGSMMRDPTVRIEGSSGEFETLLRNIMVTGE